MNKKLFLTSLTAIAIAMPAMAEPSNTSPTFPNDELMQQDYTYQNQANYTNMGVYTGEVSANAEYEWNIIPIVAGTYLPWGQTATTQCTSGNYCPGVATNNTTRTPHYQTEQEGDQGLYACSTVGDHTYTQSDTGASAETDCYKACATSMVAHAATVTGNDYYGAGVDTCEAVTCVNGYHKVGGAAPDFTNIEAVDHGYNCSYDGYDENVEKYGLTEADFAIDYGNTKGVIRGRGYCSSENGETVDDLVDDSSEFDCYCRFDSYTPSAGTTQPISMPWVHLGSDENCNINCPRQCAVAIESNVNGYGDTMFEFLSSTPASCEANIITINWGDTDAADVTANSAGTATYGSDIRTPVKAKSYPGKSFKGWRFEKPTPSQGN